MEILMTKSDSDIQIIFDGQMFILDFIYNPRIYALLHSVPGADNGNIIPYKWVAPKDSFHHLSILNEFIIWKSLEELKKDNERLQFHEETLEDVLNRIPSNIDTPYMKVNPYDFQKLAIGWATTPKGLRGNVYGGILADLMGLGKTIQAIAIAGELKRQGKINNCLIICPSTLKFQWSQEIENFTDESYVIIDGTPKQREKQFQKLSSEKPFFTIVNYELLISKGKRPDSSTKTKKQHQNVFDFKEYPILNSLLEIKHDFVVLDEAHRIKNPEAKTSKAVRHIQPYYKLLMTGTPITKDLQNVFNLVDYLSPSILGEANMSFEERLKAFEDNFLVMTHNKFAKFNPEKVVTGVRNVGILKRLLAPYMLRRTTEEVSDELPEQIEKTIFAEWDTEQKKLYDSLAKELKNLKIKKSEAKNEFEAQSIENEMHSLYTYLLEVCNTPELLELSDSRSVKKRLDKEVTFKNPPKLKRLLEKVEELMMNDDDKIIIFSKFERMTQIIEREVSAISKKMPELGGESFNSVLYTGKTPKGCEWKKQLEKDNKESRNLNCNECPLFNECNTRTKSQFLFQNDPKTKIIIATDAANYGVNLQSGRYLFNYDLPDAFATYDQRKGRNKRLGSKYKQVFVYNFCIDGAIDSQKIEKLLKQKEIIDLVVEKSEEEEHSIYEKMSELNMMNELLKNT